AGAGGPDSGAIRADRDAPAGSRPGEGAAPPARAQLPAAAGDRRPGELLEERLPAGAEGAPRPLPEALVARRPAHRRGRARGEADTVTANPALAGGVRRVTSSRAAGPSSA